MLHELPPFDLTADQVSERRDIAEAAGDDGTQCFLCKSTTGLLPSKDAALCQACYRWFISDDEYADE